jgi:hypothetical protein
VPSFGFCDERNCRAECGGALENAKRNLTNALGRGIVIQPSQRSSARSLEAPWAVSTNPCAAAKMTIFLFASLPLSIFHNMTSAGRSHTSSPGASVAVNRYGNTFLVSGLAQSNQATRLAQ